MPRCSPERSVSQASSKAKSKSSSRGSKKAPSSKKSSTSNKTKDSSHEDVQVSSDDLGDVDIDESPTEDPPMQQFGSMGALSRMPQQQLGQAHKKEASPKTIGDDSGEFRDSQLLSMFRDDKGVRGPLICMPLCREVSNLLTTLFVKHRLRTRMIARRVPSTT